MSAGTVLSRACVIALCGVIAGGVVSARHKPLVNGFQPPPVTPPPVSPDVPISVNVPPPLPFELTIAQSLELFGKGAPFVDARRRDEYEAGHVQNAYWMPADLLTTGARPEALDFLTPEQPIVIYCGGGECDASKNVAALLQQGGFSQLHVMTDGYPGWTSAGHPVGTGKPEYETVAPEGH